MDRRRLLLALAALVALAPRSASAQRRSLPDGPAVPGWRTMNSDLVLIGPSADPAGVSGMQDAAEALRRIASMADRSAWLALRDRRTLRIVVEGDRRFSN
jgi:ABC-type tungstate transport system permease subunit